MSDNGQPERATPKILPASTRRFVTVASSIDILGLAFILNLYLIHAATATVAITVGAALIPGPIYASIVLGTFPRWHPPEN